jgi:PIN domain nuclease of toxin-antitoxin system
LIVLDTHALVWWLSGSPELSTSARRALKRVTASAPAVASTISVLEIATAVRRARMQFGVSLEQWLECVQWIPELRFEAVSVEIARIAGSFGEDMHGDPADRIIAATALTLGASLVTGDDKLRSHRALRTIW